MKSYLLLNKYTLVFLSVIVSQQIYSQQKLFIGPSIQFNHYNWGGIEIHTFAKSVGSIFGTEYSIRKKYKFNISVNTHYGRHSNYRFPLNTNKQTDVFISIQPEFRFFTFKNHKNRFIGVGTEIRQFRAYNYYEENAIYSIKTCVEIDLFATATIGFYYATKNNHIYSFSLLGGFSGPAGEHGSFLQLKCLYYFGKQVAK